MMTKLKKVVRKLIYLTFPSSYVLMFHHIDDGKINKKSGCILEYKRFVDILDSGLEFISMDDYVDFSIKNRNKCTITFDDGLQDVYRVAYPELKARNIPFTIFVVTSFLNKDGYITSEELKEMSSDKLVTVGSHGISHNVLSSMSVEDQKVEICKSKMILQKLIDRPVKYFAFSHGSYSDVTLSLFNDMGCYEYAFTVGGMPTNVFTCRWKYHLPRLNCESEKMNFYIDKKKNKANLKIKI